MAAASAGVLLAGFLPGALTLTLAKDPGHGTRKVKVCCIPAGSTARIFARISSPIGAPNASSKETSRAIGESGRDSRLGMVWVIAQPFGDRSISLAATGA